MARLADELVEGRTDGVSELFHEAGAPAPFILWRPAPQDLVHPSLRRFAGALRPFAQENGALPSDVLPSVDLADVAGDTAELQSIDHGADFVYAHYGANIAAVRGVDMTGKTTLSFPGHIGVFFTALYRAIIRRGEAALSLHEPPDDVFSSAWRRLMVPVLEADGGCLRVLSGIAADNALRAGLEATPDPVLVVTEDGRVAFANMSARMLFGDPIQMSRPAVEAYTGLEIDLGFDRASRGIGALREIKAAAVQGQLIVHYAVTTSVLTFRDAPICVMVVKPE